VYDAYLPSFIKSVQTKVPCIPGFAYSKVILILDRNGIKKEKKKVWWAMILSIGNSMYLHWTKLAYYFRTYAVGIRLWRK